MTIISAPFERLKILLQVQGQNPQENGHHKKAPSSATAILRGIYLKGGVRSIYRGSLMTFAKDAPDSAVYFTTYEYCKKQFTPTLDNGTEGSLSFLAVSGAGASAGLMTLIPLFPIDTVKSRLQAAEGKQSVGSTVRHVYSRGGFEGILSRHWTSATESGASECSINSRMGDDTASLEYLLNLGLVARIEWCEFRERSSFVKKTPG